MRALFLCLLAPLTTATFIATVNENLRTAAFTCTQHATCIFNRTHVEDWDTSMITEMRQLFKEASTFNQPLNASEQRDQKNVPHF